MFFFNHELCWPPLKTNYRKVQLQTKSYLLFGIPTPPENQAEQTSSLVFLYSRLNITCTRSVYSHCTFITLIERVGFPLKRPPSARKSIHEFLALWEWKEKGEYEYFFFAQYTLVDRRLLVRNSIEHYTTFSCRCKPVSPVQPDFLRRGKRFKNCHRI